MFINDVGSHYMDPYIPVIEQKRYTWFSGITLNAVRVTSSFFALTGLALLVYCFTSKELLFQKLAGVAGAVVLILFGSIFIGIELLKKFIRGKVSANNGLNLKKSFSDEILRNMFHRFGSTPIAVLGVMLQEGLVQY